MFNHHDIWNAIDKLASAKGYTASGLAKLAGLDPTTFNKSKRITSSGKLRWPSTESISKILFVTNTDLSEFMSYLNGEAMEVHYNHLPYILENKDKNSHEDLLNTDEKLAFFPNNENKHLAFEISSDELADHYERGSVLILELETTHRRNDKILIRLKDNSLKCGVLKRETSNNIFIDSHDDNISLSREDIEWSARILWAGQ